MHRALPGRPPRQPGAPPAIRPARPATPAAIPTTNTAASAPDLPRHDPAHPPPGRAEDPSPGLPHAPDHAGQQRVRPRGQRRARPSTTLSGCGDSTSTAPLACPCAAPGRTPRRSSASPTPGTSGTRSCPSAVPTTSVIPATARTRRALAAALALAPVRLRSRVSSGSSTSPRILPISPCHCCRRHRAPLVLLTLQLLVDPPAPGTHAFPSRGPAAPPVPRPPSLPRRAPELHPVRPPSPPRYNAAWSAPTVRPSSVRPPAGLTWPQPRLPITGHDLVLHHRQAPTDLPRLPSSALRHLSALWCYSSRIALALFATIRVGVIHFGSRWRYSFRLALVSTNAPSSPAAQIAAPRAADTLSA